VPDQQVEAVSSAASYDLLLMAVGDLLLGLIRALDSRAAREISAQPHLVISGPALSVSSPNERNIDCDHFRFDGKIRQVLLAL
jgi:hypothetical protein